MPRQLNPKAASPPCLAADAAGVLGARKLASAFDPPGTHKPARTRRPADRPPPKPASTHNRGPPDEKRQQATAVQSGFAAVPRQLNPKAASPPCLAADAAGVLGAAEARFRFRSARNAQTGAHEAACRRAPAKARKYPQPRPPGRKRQQATAVQSGFAAVPRQLNPKAASPRCFLPDAEGVLGVRKLASAFDPPGTHKPARTSRPAEASPPKPGKYPTTEASPEKAAASYRSPKRLRRGAPTAQSQSGFAALSTLAADAAGVLGARKLASAFDPPGTHKPARTSRPADGPPPKPASTHNRGPPDGKRQQATAVQSGFAAVPRQLNPKAASPSCLAADAAGVLGARKLASAFDPPGTHKPARTSRPADGPSPKPSR